MQNGGYPWVASSSLSQKSWHPGYQASLTDLFLKKNPLHFGTGISQLAAASSYIEKMSTFAGDHMPKCPHPDAKDKPYPCDICQQYFNLCSNLRTDNPSSASGIPNRPASTPVTSATALSSISERKSQLQQQQPPPSMLSSAQPLDRPPPHHAMMPPASAPHQPGGGHGRPRQSPTKQFICPVCHKYFTQKGNLKTHMMIHTGEKPYACQICGKCFTQKGNVDTHMKIHTGEKEFSCDSCGKRFTQKGNLKTHIRSVHTKEKPFACGVCGKSFSQKGNMQTHMRTHNKDDRFPCTLCGKTFSQKGNLKTHMQRHTGQLPARRSYNSRGTSVRATSLVRRTSQMSSQSAFSIQPTSSPSHPSSISPINSPGGNKMPPNSLGSLPSPRSAVSTPLPDHHHCKPSPGSQLSHIPSPALSLTTSGHMHRPQNGSPNSQHMSSPPPQLEEMHSHHPMHRKSPILSHHGQIHMDSLAHSHSIHNGMSSSHGAHNQRMTSPNPADNIGGHLANSDSDARPFYSAPPTPIATPLSPTPRWLPPDHPRHYPGFQSTSSIGSYNTLSQYGTPLSRLSLLASSANPHHPLANHSEGEKPLPAHSQNISESHFHHSGNPDFSQLLD